MNPPSQDLVLIALFRASVATMIFFYWLGSQPRYPGKLKDYFDKVEYYGATLIWIFAGPLGLWFIMEPCINWIRY